jgi:hypothetical protein
MPTFRVSLEGRNFLLLMEGKRQRLGFTTARFVEADDAEEAEALALDRLRADPRLHGTSNDPAAPPEIFVGDIDEVDRGDVPKAAPGFAFFPDDTPSDA